MANYTRNTLTGDLAPVNAELEKVQQSIADKLDRNPSTGQANQLDNTLDANSNRIINLPAPSSPNDAARLADVAASQGTSVLPPQVGQANKYLRTDSTTPYWDEITKTSLGLGNVDNTSDANKPVSIATNVELIKKASYVNTFTALALLSPTEGKIFVCIERANAEYIVQASGYVALAGDVTFANGLIGALQINGLCDLYWFGALQNAESLLDSATNDLAACNLAALRMQQEGGGTILMSGLAALSGTLVIPQRVVFKGTSKFFANQFTNNNVRPAGCGFYALATTNANIVDLKLDIYNDGGTLRETVNNKILSDYRYFGGVENLIIYGNRSNTANPPTVVDKNTSGSGLVVSGVRYPVIKNVVSMMCASDGVETVSFNYGLGANACNNILTESITSISNAENGFSLSGGDSILTGLNAGYNGVTGISSVMGAAKIEGISWNNEVDGVAISGGDRANYNINSYDNKRNGIRITNTIGCVVRGLTNANGRNTALGTTDRVGVLVGNSNELLRLDVVSNGSYLGTNYQAYGFNISNATFPICVAGCFAGNNFTANWLITTPANIIKDTNAP